ncbi:hypothetical protein TNIN_298482 [Trichonephila inaurata madagascariensis]|uniref:Uncharacterized protein n=1 Tax=Trichonephila inaurata madagascariensis TaxID=2747483 RepID=A0A8X6IAX3_9ARAC|nr:hypothetical protein TNIN_298482 [Trichonephila inaurata madagascariensis]
MELNMDQHLEHGNGMDLSLPLSTNTSRPGTPQHSNCQQLKDTAYLIKKKKPSSSEYQKAATNALRIKGIADETSMNELQKLEALRASPKCGK